MGKTEGHSHAMPMEKGPVYTLSFESHAKKTKELKDKNKKICQGKQMGQPITPNGIPEADNDGTPSNVTAAPNYLNSLMLMDSAGIDGSSLTAIEFRVLKMRTDNQMKGLFAGSNHFDVLRQLAILWSKFDADWRKLLCNARK